MPATRETLGFGVFASFNPNGVAPGVGRNPVGVDGFVGPLDPGSSVARPTLGYEARPRGGRRLVVFSIHRRLRRTHRQEPSPQDIRLSKEYPETMGTHQVVISCEKVYHIDNDGLVTVVGRTAEVLKLEIEEPNP